MKLWSHSFNTGQPVPSKFAFCEPDAQNHVRLASNFNPHLAWSDIPEGTRSLVLVCVDPDAPASPELVNREEATIPAAFPRADFYHWSIIDLPPYATSIEEGAFSSSVVAKGKTAQSHVMEFGREGLNDYTAWFAEDEQMKGSYGGYDGPCPPWNDERIHHYRFRLFALDIRSLGLPPVFDGRDVMTAIEEHIIAAATLEGTYTLNSSLPNI